MFIQFHKNIAYLKNNGTPWLTPRLNDSLKALIPKDTEFKALSKGTVIIKENEYPDQLVYVKSGSVCTSFVNDYVMKNILITGIFPEGGLTASMANIADYVEYRRIEVFSKSTVVGLVPFMEIEKQISRDHSLYKDYVTYASKCDKTRIATLKINSSYPPDLRYKLYLAAKLVSIGVHIPEPDKNVWLPVPYPAGRHKHHLALNVSKSTIDRMLEEWRAKGYYKYINNIYHIHASALSELNDFSLQYT